ncbi:OLC1v1018343C1 [Oldenlandia corymbosa var. corymbosa]|uniref:OLC1v1018343C1 n=1 Tax=Oldenlandia corymbosa var. corymbosa TaxID=529605 RepID=A0AAV1EBP4_OLDCO|nr:OLC1v1018343C1 [Oldenlandia corymbosa var. corymbosa]
MQQQCMMDQMLITKPLILLIIGFLVWNACYVEMINAQVSIPAKMDGFWYLNRRPVTEKESVVIEAFFDPVCPDTRDAWQPLKQAVHHYGPRVTLVVHTFSLPYHDNAFVCSRALHIVYRLNSSATYPLLESFFDQQEKFYGRATANLTRPTVVNNVVKLAAQTVGSSYESAIEQGFKDTKTDQATRIAFKYGCLRGVFGTPYFFVNGFPLPDAGSPLDFNGWRKIIDPLLSQSMDMPDMDRYRKVEKPKAETPIDENEIRITSQGRMRSYITYAMSLLQEKGSEEVVFKAMGRAINKTVTIVELIKRRIVGLHQITSITSTDINDTWEPLEEGLLPLQTTRHVSMITITLSKKELDTSALGYQPPIPADQVKVSAEIDYDGEGSPNGRGRGRGGRGRGRFRGASGNGYAGGEYEDGGWENNRGYGRGRGRGRGRNFRGRGRGGYNGPHVDNQEDAGGYNQEPPFQGGRGRGRGRGTRGRGRGFRSNGQIHAAVQN